MNIWSNLERGMNMVCDICGKEGARIRRIAKTYGKGKDILVIEKCPCSDMPSLRWKLPWSRNTPRNRTDQASQKKFCSHTRSSRSELHLMNNGPTPLHRTWCKRLTLKPYRASFAPGTLAEHMTNFQRKNDRVRIFVNNWSNRRPWFFWFLLSRFRGLYRHRAFNWGLSVQNYIRFFSRVLWVIHAS